jgi:hypothetical protein
VAEGIARAGSTLRGHLTHGASRVGASVQAGLGKVERALDDPSAEIAGELREQADLPELVADSPLASLAVRLDREADLWRTVALRQQERSAWTGRLTIVGAMAALIGAIALAAIGGFRALLGGGVVGAPPLLLGVSAAILALGTLCTAFVLERSRRGQLEIARSALLRADLAEARLHRIAAVAELRTASPDRYADALAALERDVRNA